MDSEATPDAGRALRRKIIADTLLLNGAAIFGQILGIAQRFLVMRFIAPEAFGVWLGALILLGYAAYAHAGLEHGMGVRIPYHMGRGDRAAVEDLRSTAYTVWTGIALVAAASLAAYALLQARADLRPSFLAVALLIVLEQQSAFFTRWHSAATQNFALITKLSVAKAAVTFVFVVVLSWAFGLNGLVAGTVIGAAVTVFLWHRSDAPALRLHLSRPSLWELLRIGFPILLVVLLGGLIDTIDRAVIGLLLGTTALGYYGVTTLGGASVYGLLAQAGSAMSPHMASDFGRANGSPAALERYLVRPTMLFSAAAALLVSSIMYVVPPIVRLFLPAYAPGLPAFYAYTPGFFFLALIITANNAVNLILIERRQQRLFVYLQAAALMVEVAVAVAAIRLGFGVTGVAFASTLAYATYALTTVTLAGRFVLGDWRRVSGFVLKLLAPMAYLGAVSVGVLGLTSFPDMHVIASAAAQAGLFALAAIPLLVWILRASGGNFRSLTGTRR